MRLAGFIAVFIALASGGIYGVLRSFNYFETVEHAFAGQCAPVTGVDGPEDIQIDAAAQRAFISSLDRRAKDARGKVHIFDLADPLAASNWRDRTTGVPEDFRPLGIDYYEDDEVRRLFVVNEANAAVEMFDVRDGDQIVHLETFSERRMTSPNNVVAVGRRSFYVTNDVKAGRTSRMADLQFLTRAATGEVLYTDGGIWRVVAEGLRFANGIEVSLDGERLFVAETAGGAVRIYERGVRNGSLMEIDRVNLPAAPDNITIDDSGALWIAALPKPLTMPRHGANPETPSPSEIFYIAPDSLVPETIYRDDGAELSASTVAARLGKTLLVGALYDSKFLICDLPDDGN